MLSGRGALHALIGHVLAMAAVIALLTAPAGWIVKLLAIAALFPCWRHVVTKTDRPEQLSLWHDGTALLSMAGQPGPAVQTGHAWVSSFLCVVCVRLEDDSKTRHCLVYAAHNHPDDFRRLKAWCRAGLPSVGTVSENTRSSRTQGGSPA